MDPTRWATVRRLFEQVIGASPEDPRTFLLERTADESLVGEVLELLEVDARTETPLDAPPPTPAAAFPGGRQGSGPLTLPDVEVAPYRLLEPIGRGGMGAVFTASRADGAVDRTVALKLVHAGLDSADVLSRFEGEQRILARLEHPNIARLYDAGRASDGRPFLVMEYVQGKRIGEYCEDAGLDLRGRIRLFLQVCDAVAHAHQAFVIHRDLKPSNILVTEDGTVKLLDFGIAKLVDPEGEGAPTETGYRVMTLEYASPEQIRGEVLTTASDVYALGIVLYELLTGERPVEGREQALVRALAPEDAPDLPSPSARVTGRQTAGTLPDQRLARALRGDLDQILLKALRSDPHERYADVGDLSADLRAYLEGRPVSAQPPSVPYRVRKFVSRRRGGVTAAVLVFLLMVWGASVFTWQARRVAQERDLAVAVSTFLEDLFRASDPRTGLVRDTTRMVDFLEVAEERVRTGLADRPRTRARLQLILGTVYRNLSRPDLAIPVLEEAVAAHEEAYARPVADAVESHRLLGLSLAETGDVDAGVRALETALARQLRLVGPRAVETARLRETMGRAYAEAQRNEEALPWLEQAVDAQRAQEPRDPVALASSLNTMANVLVQLGRLPEAAPLLEEAADVLNEAGEALPRGVRQSDEGYSRNNLSQVLMNLNRREEAREQADRAWLLLDSAFTGPNPAKATNLQRRATLLATSPDDFETGLAEADSLYRSSLAMRAQLPREPGGLMFGWNAYARSLRSWSRSLGRSGLMDQALEAFRRSVAEGTADFGRGHPLVMSARADLGKTLVEAGRAAEGIVETEPAFEAIVAAVPSGHPMVANAAIAHATALTANGRAGDAVALLDRTREPLIQALGEEHPLVASMDEARADALEMVAGGD